MEFLRVGIGAGKWKTLWILFIGILCWMGSSEPPFAITALLGVWWIVEMSEKMWHKAYQTAYQRNEELFSIVKDQTEYPKQMEYYSRLQAIFDGRI